MHKLVAKVVHQTLLTVKARKEPKSSFRRKDCPAVPGTGGCSMSIEIGTDTNYARVIVTGGGSSGLNTIADRRDFVGGQIGGSCTYKATLQSQGAGTQIGSTCGLWERQDRQEDPIKFGLYYTGKYCDACNSGWGGCYEGGYGCGKKETLKMHLRMF